jgi:polyhydroxyalkanoate synthesis regulator phasin
VAQDFAAAFAVGEDDKHIATVDADGVALAAIQGLYQLVTEQQSSLRARESEVHALQGRLEKLERLVTQLTAPRKEK